MGGGGGSPFGSCYSYSVVGPCFFCGHSPVAFEFTVCLLQVLMLVGRRGGGRQGGVRQWRVDRFFY